MAHAQSADSNVFLLPDLGEGVHEAELLKWRVAVGQTVQEHDILADMETDKAVVEVPSPRTGVIKVLHGAEGEIVNTGNPLVTYEGSANAKSSNGTKPEAKAPSRVEAAPRAQVAEVAEPSSEREDNGSVVGSFANTPGGNATGKALATPVVRRIAKELGVDIDTVTGSGIGGRVLEKDVRAMGGGNKAPSKAAPIGGFGDVAPMDRSEPHSRMTEAAPARSPSKPAPAPALRAAMSIPSAEEITRIPFRGVRRTIANRLRESVNQAVHFTVMDEADVSALDSLRRKLGAASGEKVSFLPFVAGAVCRVLGDSRFRSLNANSNDGAEEIVQFRSVHLGIATDTDAGLMVPVIRDADRLGVLEISRAIAMTADMARGRSIPREQLIGGTFTISNVGSHAGRFATPIINYPEVGILAVGRAREGMIVSKGTFRVGQVLPLSLACDHRVVDGATAALALAEIIRLLADPDGLLTPARA